MYDYILSLQYNIYNGYYSPDLSFHQIFEIIMFKSVLKKFFKFAMRLILAQ